jgi:hypothetical protein
MRKRKTIEVDHVMHSMRLCWRARKGGPWHKSEYRPMTKGYAAKMVEYMERKFPDFEHWIEEEGTDAQ